jgi:tetratricopeptide (TPR) repeat protein
MMHSPSAWFYLGQVLQDAGYYKKSLKAYQVSMLYNPDQEDVFLKLESLSKACQANSAMLKAHPKTPLPPPLLPSGSQARR